MAITIADVESPAGELDMAVLFPGDGTATAVGAWQDRIAGYIEDAAARLDDDDFAYHWVHYRAYHAKYIEMSASAASGELPEGGSYQYFVTQIANMQELANYHKVSAEGYLNVVEPYHPTTRAATNEFSW